MKDLVFSQQYFVFWPIQWNGQITSNCVLEKNKKESSKFKVTFINILQIRKIEFHYKTKKTKQLNLKI